MAEIAIEEIELLLDAVQELQDEVRRLHDGIRAFVAPWDKHVYRKLRDLLPENQT